MKFKVWSWVDKDWLSQKGLALAAVPKDDCTVLCWDDLFNRWLFNAAPLEIVWFSSLSDRKGRGIYTGDILKRPTGATVFKVIFEQGAFLGQGLEVNLSRADFKDCEIIGNVYENPELLPVKLREECKFD